jgi:hypothetical protein
MFLRETDPGLGRSGRVKPQLESLEDRCCPSTVAFHYHVLTLTGGSSNSTMVVRDDGHGDVAVTLNGRTTHYAGVQQIDVNSKTGDDTINYALTGRLTTSEQLSLHLGAGSDLVRLDYSRGVAAPNLTINIDGGVGDQNVTALFGPITNTNLQVNANLRYGFDHFTALFNGDLTGRANVDVDVNGGSGILGVNVQERGAIASTAQMAIDEYLGSNNNTSHVDYTGKLSGRLAINVQGGPQWDWLESTINLTPGSTGTLYDHELGGAGSDLLMLMVHDPGSHLRSLSALIDGQGGFNTAVRTPNVRVLNAR